MPKSASPDSLLVILPLLHTVHATSDHQQPGSGDGGGARGLFRGWCCGGEPQPLQVRVLWGEVRGRGQQIGLSNSRLGTDCGLLHSFPPRSTL